MTDKIRAHIDALFRDAPSTRRVLDAREELLAGCLDKYADLTASGRSPEEAYIAVISGIGDVDELLRAIGQLDAADPRQEDVSRKKRAFFIAAGVFLFIMSAVSAIVVDQFVGGDLPGVVFLTLAAVAIFVLLYGVMSTRVRVERPAVSMSEEIQQQLTGGGRNSKLRGTASSSMWTLLVLVYLFIGFFTGWWHPGWLIFPIGAVLQLFINIAFGKPASFRANLIGLLWTMTAVVYLILSFLTDRWEFTWLLFPMAACVQQMLHLRRVWRDSNEK